MDSLETKSSTDVGPLNNGVQLVDVPQEGSNLNLLKRISRRIFPCGFKSDFKLLVHSSIPLVYIYPKLSKNKTIKYAPNLI